MHYTQAVIDRRLAVIDRTLAVNDFWASVRLSLRQCARSIVAHTRIYTYVHTQIQRI